jgi:hypothetical protein
MANKSIKTRIQHKRELEVNWLNSSLVPLEGELVVYLKEIDPVTKEVLKNDDGSLKLPNGRTEPYTYDRFKIGDGHTNVNELDFIGMLTGTTDPNANTKSQYYFKYSL